MKFMPPSSISLLFLKREKGQFLCSVSHAFSKFYRQQFFMSLYFNLTSLQNMRSHWRDKQLKLFNISGSFRLFSTNEEHPHFCWSPAWFHPLTECCMCPSRFWSHNNTYQKLFNGLTEEDCCRSAVKTRNCWMIWEMEPCCIHLWN